MPDSINISVPDGGMVTALVYLSTKPGSTVTIILGHGAGAPQTSKFMVDFATGLTGRGCNAVTFNFPYTEHGRKIPDRPEKLEACYKQVIEDIAAESRFAEPGLIIGGKSMGGRIASQVAASDALKSRASVKGLVFLGYPLHPPGRPDRLRAEHLSRIGLPMLFVQGSRDSFGTPEELSPIIGKLDPRPSLFPIDEGDHSFKVPKRAPLSQEQVYTSVLDKVVRWSVDVAASTRNC